MSAPRPWLAPESQPDATALIFKGRSISRAQLAAQADSLARWLGEQGIGTGDVVAALLPNGIPFVALLHAIDRRGAVLLPLNTRHTPHELAPPLSETRTRVLLHDGGELGSTARTVGRLAGKISVRQLQSPGQCPVAPVFAPPGIEPPFAILYTSGTTGRPKGALLSHANFRASALASARHLEIRPDDRWLACLPLFHVGGLSILLRSAMDGVPVVLQERFDPEAVNDALDRDGISRVSLVPTQLTRLLEVRGDRPPPPQLRCVLLGGGAASPGLIERALAARWPLAPTYGLTETASQVATLRPGGDPLRDGLEPLPGTAVQILGADGANAPTGEPGEIVVRGPTVMLGYVERPEQNRMVLRDGWLHTDDVGSLDAQGRLHVYERRTDLIISGGENVYPAEVETVLEEHPAVVEAGVTGIPDPDFGQRPAAWLVIKPGEQISDAELTRFCRERLAGYKIPVRYQVIDALPRSASGKLQRAELPDPKTKRPPPREN